MTVNLKQYLGEAGAGLDESIGYDTLYDVLRILIDRIYWFINKLNAMRSRFLQGIGATTATEVQYLVLNEDPLYEYL